MKKYGRLIAAAGLVAGMMVFSGCGDDEIEGTSGGGTTPSTSTTSTTPSTSSTTSTTSTSTSTTPSTTSTTSTSSTSSTSSTTSTTTTTTVPPQTITVTGEGSGNAATGDLTYALAAGNYTYTIAGFGTGDVLDFPAGNNPAVNNSSLTDGIVELQWASSGQVVKAVLTGLSASQDVNIFGLTSFKAAFGLDSIK